MKKSIALLLIGVLLLAACGGEITPPENENEAADLPPATPAIVTPTPEEVPPVTPTPAPLTEQLLLDLALLELFGYHINENGHIIIDYAPEVFQTAGEDVSYMRVYNEFDPDAFREHFYGAWSYVDWVDGTEQTTYIDDAGPASSVVFTGRFGWAGENVIVNFFRSCGHQQMVWIDLNEPDVMYSLAPVSFWEEEGVYVGNIDDGRQYPLVSVYTRIDAPLNEPEENYLGRLKIFELAHKHEIPAELFFDFYLTEDNDESYFIGAGQVFFAPIYLVSETSDKIVLASEVIHWQNQEISDAVIMIEKIGDEWVRTTSLVEYDMFPDL